MTEQTRTERNRAKQETWSSHVEGWKRSGLSQVDYCRQHDLSRHRFTYWKCKLDKKEVPVKFIPISEDPFRSQTGYNNQTPIRLNIGGFQIEIGDGFSPETLSTLIFTLGRL